MDPTPRIYVAVPGSSGRPISYTETGKVVLFDKNSQLFEAIKPGNRVKALIVVEKENYTLVAPIEVLPPLPAVEAQSRPPEVTQVPPEHPMGTAHIALAPLQGEEEVYAIVTSGRMMFPLRGVPKKYQRGKFRVVYEFLGEVSTSRRPNRKPKRSRRKK